MAPLTCLLMAAPLMNLCMLACWLMVLFMLQIHCIRDKEGVIVDGAEDDVRAVFYTWAFQLDQDAYDLNWQVIDLP